MLLFLLGALASPPPGVDDLEAAIEAQKAGDKEGFQTSLAAARTKLTKAAAASPTPEVLHQLGLVYYWAREDAKAEETWSKVLVEAPDHADTLRYLASLLQGRQDWAGSAAFLARLAAIEPANLVVQYNLGVAAHLSGDLAVAEIAFGKVYDDAPDDWMTLSKLVQVAQARGDEETVRERIGKLKALASSGAAPKLAERGFFTREQFQAAGMHVIVLEYFELKGDRPVRYVFRLAKDNVSQGRLSLGSYAKTTAFMKEAGKLEAGQRAWHLDRYLEDGGHQTFGFFDSEPGYAAVRKAVVAILEGSVQPASSAMPDRSRP